MAGAELGRPREVTGGVERIVLCFGPVYNLGDSSVAAAYHLLAQVDTASVVQRLQGMCGGRVLGLTARDRALVPLTLRQLDGLGIHFEAPGGSAGSPVELGDRVLLAHGIAFDSRLANNPHPRHIPRRQDRMIVEIRKRL